MTDSRTHSGSRPRRLRPAHLLPLLAVALLLLGAANAFAITRGTVLARAQRWIDDPVPYSQSRYFGGYRTDCSGFTSMAWQLGRSLTTRSLQQVSHRISVKDLKPGDALIAYDNHVRVFYGWVDAEHTSYVAYEQTGARAATLWRPATPSSKSSIKLIQSDWDDHYFPYRYDKITDGPPTWNLVANNTFNVWDQTSMRGPSGAPVWWELPETGYRESLRRAGVAKSTIGNSSLGLSNASSRTVDVVEIRQTSAVKPGRPYTLSVLARTAADPAGLELRLEFLDADGDALATASTTGARAGVVDSAFRQMTVTATAPPEAVSARIGARLAGGIGSPDTTGTTAFLDIFKLYDSSPVVSGLSASKTIVDKGDALTLSGVVTAPMALGSVRIHVRRPGSSAIIALRDMPLIDGAWTTGTRLGLRGTYTYTATYLGFGPWGPVTSEPVAVRVR